jgi:hypothetical protein
MKQEGTNTYLGPRVGIDLQAWQAAIVGLHHESDGTCIYISIRCGCDHENDFLRLHSFLISLQSGTPILGSLMYYSDYDDRDHLADTRDDVIN